MQALGAKEMGGKTGTTNENADAWFFGYTPQLLAGTWIGSDDRFIHIESAQGMGGSAARPIWQAFFKKVYSDKSLGIDRDAEFVKPPEMQNPISDADMTRIIDNQSPDSVNNNSTNGNDYSLDTTNSYIPPESQRPNDNDEDVPAPPKKERPKRDSSKTVRIGDMTPTDNNKKKHGFFNNLFGKRKNNN